MNEWRGGETVNDNKKRIRADVLLIAALLLLSGAFLLVRQIRRAGGNMAVVYVDGKRTAAYPLSKDVTVTLTNRDGGVNLLVIENGTADVRDASCPDKLCVHMHPIQYVGETITCLPNRTMIQIQGRGEPEVDVG